MYCYRIVEITNLEPLKIGARGAQSTYAEPTAEYIPGSTLRGALISQLIHLGLFDDNTKSGFLLGMECYNAYPYSDGVFYLPRPFHLRVDKHEWRKARAHGKKMMPLSNLWQEKGNTSGAKNQPEYSFIAVEHELGEEKRDALRGKNVIKEYRLHHSTCKSQVQEPENLFRYEAISAGQKFWGILKYNKELEPQFNALLGEKRIIYLGGSKGSGYGKSEIKTVDGPLGEYDEIKQLLGIKSSPKNSDEGNSEMEIVITCLSDCLFRNEWGQPINHLSEQYLYGLTGKYPTLERQFVQTGKTEGYNTTWQARYPKETTVKAGSVLIYSFAEGLTSEEIQRLEGTLLGSRNQDGYGWLGVDLYYPEYMLLDDRKENSIHLEELLQEKPVSETFKILIGGLKDAKERWLKMLFGQLSGNFYDDNKNKALIISLKLNNSQLKNMEDLIDDWVKSKEKGNPYRLEDKSKTILERHYINDKTLFSLNDCDLNRIWNYLKGNSNDELRGFANITLSTQRGSLFYYDIDDKEQAARKFIADLVKTGLYIERMGRGRNE